jgi:hypothetical protein
MHLRRRTSALCLQELLHWTPIQACLPGRYFDYRKAADWSLDEIEESLAFIYRNFKGEHVAAVLMVKAIKENLPASVLEDTDHLRETLRRGDVYSQYFWGKWVDLRIWRAHWKMLQGIYRAKLKPKRKSSWSKGEAKSALATRVRFWVYGQNIDRKYGKSGKGQEDVLYETTLG